MQLDTVMEQLSMEIALVNSFLLINQLTQWEGLGAEILGNIT